MPDMHTPPWALALPGALQERLSNHELGRTQHCQEGQQWAGEGWLLPACLPSQIRVQMSEQAVMPTRREAHRQLVRAFSGVTEAVAYL